MSGQQDWEAGAVNLKLNCVILTIDLGKLVEARYVLTMARTMATSDRHLDTRFWADNNQPWLQG